MNEVRYVLLRLNRESQDYYVYLNGVIVGDIIWNKFSQTMSCFMRRAKPPDETDLCSSGSYYGGAGELSAVFNHLLTIVHCCITRYGIFDTPNDWGFTYTVVKPSEVDTHVPWIPLSKEEQRWLTKTPHLHY